MAKWRKALRFKEANKISLNATNLVALQCGELKIKIKKIKNIFPECPPWNGAHNNIRMTNTCTIHIALYAIHVALTNSPELTAAFRSSDDATVRRLYDIHQFFEWGQFALGKYHWSEQFPHLFVMGQDIDAYGSEDNFFFCKLQSQTQTIFQNTWSNKNVLNQPSQCMAEL